VQRATHFFLAGLAFTRKFPTIPTANIKQPNQFPAALTRAGSPDPASRRNNRACHPAFKSLGQNAASVSYFGEC
jgi:hypothetical protein